MFWKNQSTEPRPSRSGRRICSLMFAVLTLLLATGAVAQTSKTVTKSPPKKSTAAKSTPVAKSPAAKKTVTPKKKTAPKKAGRSSKRVVRSRVQAQPTADRYTEIQDALIARGHSTGPATGIWSADWSEALKRFQQDQQLEATGKIDALSLIRLGLGPKRELTASQPAGVQASEPRAPAQ